MIIATWNLKLTIFVVLTSPSNKNGRIATSSVEKVERKSRNKKKGRKEKKINKLKF